MVEEEDNNHKREKKKKRREEDLMFLLVYIFEDYYYLIDCRWGGDIDDYEVIVDIFSSSSFFRCDVRFI